MKGPAASALTSLPGGRTTSRMFFATYGGNDYAIMFATDGSAYQILLSSGAITTIATVNPAQIPEIPQPDRKHSHAPIGIPIAQ